MRHRNLRIAWSAAWGALALWLAVLWVQSYHEPERVFSVDGGPQYFSRSGFAYEVHPFLGYLLFTRTEKNKEQTGWVTSHFTQTGGSTFSLFETKRIGDSLNARTSLWFLVALTGAIASISWLPWLLARRTLLIATTLVAVVLGLIVWLR